MNDNAGFNLCFLNIYQIAFLLFFCFLYVLCFVLFLFLKFKKEVIEEVLK